MVSKIPKTCTCIRKQKATISTTMHLYQATICEKTNYYQKKKATTIRQKKQLYYGQMCQKKREKQLY